jgi:predicted transcriptional regulator
MRAKARTAPRLPPKRGTTRPVAVRLPVEVEVRVARFARLTNRTKSAVIVGAVIEHLEWRIPQQEDLQRGLAEARAGRFVAHDAVVRKLKKLIKKHDR